MKGYIKFKATEEQLKTLSEFFSLREDFLANWKAHVHAAETVKWKIFTDTSYTFDTPPDGLFWWSWDDNCGNYRLYKKKWYEELSKLSKMVFTEEEVMLDQEAYNLVMKVLSK